MGRCRLQTGFVAIDILFAFCKRFLKRCKLSFFMLNLFQIMRTFSRGLLLYVFLISFKCLFVCESKKRIGTQLLNLRVIKVQVLQYLLSVAERLTSRFE